MSAAPKMRIYCGSCEQAGPLASFADLPEDCECGGAIMAKPEGQKGLPIPISIAKMLYTALAPKGRQS